MDTRHFGINIPKSEQPRCSGCGGPMRIQVLDDEYFWTCIKMCGTPGSEEPVGKEFLGQISIQTQAKALFEAIKAVVQQWGTQVPHGAWREVREGGYKATYMSIRYGFCVDIKEVNSTRNSVSVEVRDGKYFPSGSLESGEQMIAALAQHLASADFLNKKVNSIKRLKAITKAVQE